MRVDSDFRRLKEWWQYPGMAMVGELARARDLIVFCVVC